MQIMDMTALELGRKIKEKEVSVKEAVQASLDTIEAKDEALHSFVTVDAERALVHAAVHRTEAGRWQVSRPQ